MCFLAVNVSVCVCCHVCHHRWFGLAPSRDGLMKVEQGRNMCNVRNNVKSHEYPDGIIHVVMLFMLFMFWHVCQNRRFFYARRMSGRISKTNVRLSGFACCFVFPELSFSANINIFCNRRGFRCCSGSVVYFCKFQKQLFHWWRMFGTNFRIEC